MLIGPTKNAWSRMISEVSSIVMVLCFKRMSESDLDQTYCCSLKNGGAV